LINSEYDDSMFD